MASDIGSSSRTDEEEFLDFVEGFPSDTDSSDSQEEYETEARDNQTIVPRSGRKRPSGTAVALTEHRHTRHKSEKVDQALVAACTTPVEEPSSLKRQVSVDDLLNSDLESLKISTHTRLNPVNAGRKPVIRNALGIPVTLVESLYSVSVVTERPIVEVARVQETTLQVHIACIHRAGILKKLVSALDLNGADVHYSQILCQDNVLSMRLGFEKKKLVPHSGLEPQLVEEDENLKVTLLGIINS